MQHRRAEFVEFVEAVQGDSIKADKIFSPSEPIALGG